MFIFFACSRMPKTQQYHTFDNSSADIPLMPYVEDRIDEDTYYFGYVNAETFEIVIPAQYHYASAFIGNFAAVRKQYRNSRNQKISNYFVINKKNEVVIDNIDDVRILEAEDSKIIYALTENYSGSRGSRPEKTTYKLINLNTGKIVFEETDTSSNHDKNIRFFGNYMVFGDGLSDECIYKMENNGMFKKINAGIEKEEREENIELITRAAKEKNMENIFHLNVGWMQGYDWNITEIDLDLLLKNLPVNMRIRVDYDIWEKGKNDWIEILKKRYEEIVYYGYMDSLMRLINKDRVNPFREKDYLFSISLTTKDQTNYVGLYNATKNKWAIPPIKADTFSEFFMSQYDDWISYGRENTAEGYIYHEFYNIKTRDKNKYLYGMFQGRPANYGIFFEGTMVYMGYYKDDWYKEQEKIIEKF